MKDVQKTIWVVDDDASISEAIQVILQDSGHKVVLFDTGKDMLDEIGGAMPDLLVMDVLLTTESGIEIAKGLKSNAKFSKLPIILMSANNLTTKDIKEGKASAFLKKPFDIYALIDLVNRHA